MADVTIDAAVGATDSRGIRRVVFSTSEIGYWFYIDGDGTFGYSKTTDGGATWGAQVEIASATTHQAYDVWFDQWTPGGTGTLIHTWYFDTTNDDVFWRTLDTNGDTLGTQRVAFAASTSVSGRGVFVSGTKTRSGYLYCAFDVDAGAERGLHRSTDGGTNWSADLSDTFVEATIDQCFLFPASNTGDDNDCWALYHDASTDELTLKMWDSSAASASEGVIIAGPGVVEFATDNQGQYPFTGAVRHSDGHLLITVCTERDTGTADHRTFDINGTGSIVEKGAITTNIDDHYYPSMYIDQITNDVYVAFNGLRDGSEVMGTTTKVYYTKSTDGMASWSAGSTAYMEGAAGVIAQCCAPLCGERFYVGWRNNTPAISGNKVNSLDLAVRAGQWNTHNVSHAVSRAGRY